MKQLLSKGGNCVTQSSVGVNHQDLLVPGDKILNQIGNRKLLFCRGVFLLTGIAQCRRQRVKSIASKNYDERRDTRVALIWRFLHTITTDTNERTAAAALTPRGRGRESSV